MRQLTIMLTFFTTQLFGQNMESINIPGHSWIDTTYSKVVLMDNLTDKKIIAYNYGKNGIVYFNYGCFEELCSSYAKEAWGKEFKKILKKIKKIAKSTDTLKIDRFCIELDYITSELLKVEKGKIYDIKNNVFADTIYHRLERYGSQAHRFYYYSDHRAFLCVIEAIGILDKNNKLENYYNDYLDLGRKLREVGK